MTAPGATARPSTAAVPTWRSRLALTAALGGAIVMIAVRDPGQAGSFDLCPVHRFTGLDCAGCGLLRAVHAVSTGAFARAFDHNLFWPVVALAGLFLYARAVLGTTRAPVLGRGLPPRWVWSAVAVAAVFTVLRNLGGPFEYLAAAAG